MAGSNLFSGRGCGDEVEAIVFPISINNIVPENLDIPLEKIIKFIEKRKDERKRFNEPVEKFSKMLKQTSSFDVFRDIWNEECREIEKAVTDYKKSMDILNVTKFVGSLSFISSIVGNILGYTDVELMGSVLGLNLVTAITNKIVSNTTSAYSYLYDVHKGLSQDFCQLATAPLF